MARVEQIETWSLELHFRSSLGCHLLLSQAHEQGAGMEQLGLELVLILVADIMGSGLSGNAVMLASTA